MTQKHQDDIEDRLVRIENKLDKFLEMTAHQEADIKWVKGYIKLSISAIVAIIGAGASVVFSFLFKN